MKALKVELPDDLNLTEHDVKMMLAGQLYENRKLTLGQASGLVGITKREFIETMGNYGFSLFSQSIVDFRNDLRFGGVEKSAPTARLRITVGRSS